MGRQQYTSEVNITNMESGEIVYSRTYLGIQEENVEEKQKKLSNGFLFLFCFPLPVLVLFFYFSPNIIFHFF